MKGGCALEKRRVERVGDHPFAPAIGVPKDPLGGGSKRWGRDRGRREWGRGAAAPSGASYSFAEAPSSWLVVASRVGRRRGGQGRNRAPRREAPSGRLDRRVAPTIECKPFGIG